MCGSGQEISYKELIDPATLALRKQLVNYLSGKIGAQIPSYPGTLPYTQQPDPAQRAGLNTIMQLLGYGGGYNWPGLTKKGYTTPGGLLNDGTEGTNGGNNVPTPSPDERKKKYQPKR